jgi:hypothetical protein
MCDDGRTAVKTTLASPPPPFSMPNQMVQAFPAHSDTSFAALADATRRGVLGQRARGDASITDDACTFEMILTGMSKHVGVLEMAGLVTTDKGNRVRTCRRAKEMEWSARYRAAGQAFDSPVRCASSAHRRSACARSPPARSTCASPAVAAGCSGDCASTRRYQVSAAGMSPRAR